MRCAWFGGGIDAGFGAETTDFELGLHFAAISEATRSSHAPNVEPEKLKLRCVCHPSVT